MPLQLRGMLRQAPRSVADFDRLFRELLNVKPDPGSVGIGEIEGGVAAPNDRFYVKRAGAMVLDSVTDGDVPGVIARVAAMNAADAAVAAGAAAALAGHVAALDPHPQYYNAVRLALVVESGVYTPTLTNVANLDASAAFQCQYLRVGTVVTVSGKVSVDPTAGATLTQLGISLPIASNIGAEEDCAGTAAAPGVAGQCAAIKGDSTNDRAQLELISSATLTSQAMFFSFTYRVLP